VLKKKKKTPTRWFEPSFFEKRELVLLGVFQTESGNGDLPPERLWSNIFVELFRWSYERCTGWPVR